jgi:ketosteroid isomerase-like protein
MIWKAVAASSVLALSLTGCAHSPSAQTSGQALIEARFATFNDHDLDGLVKLYSPTAVMTAPGYCTPRQGEEGVRRAYGDLFKAYPTITDEVTDTVVQGDHIAVQFTAHVGKYAFPIASFLTVQDGVITRDDTYFDGQGQHCT